MGLARRVPWWGKLGAKLVLARLPVARSAWSRLGIFLPGDARDPDHAAAVFRKHFDAVRELVPVGFTLLELGPGDALATAPLAAAEGAARVHLVDSAAAARADDVDLAACRATYLTAGLASLRTIPDDSVDVVFSNAVLEHVRRDEFDAVIRELHRLQKPGGVASHQVDFRDHLGGSLNNLRFPEAVWESRLFRESGFYTNRLAPSDVVRTFEDAGYRIVSRGSSRWTRPPLPRGSLHASFRGRSEEDLTTADFHLVVRKQAR